MKIEIKPRVPKPRTFPFLGKLREESLGQSLALVGRYSAIMLRNHDGASATGNGWTINFDSAKFVEVDEEVTISNG